MDYFEACKVRYYSKGNKAEVINELSSTLNLNVNHISNEFLLLLNEILFNEPNYYLNKEILEQTYKELEDLFKKFSGKISFDERVMEHFIIGYHAYSQISDIIKDLSELNDSPTIKNRLYRIPTYISIVEGCLTNLFLGIILIIDKTTTRDFSTQNKLSPICEILSSNGFKELVQYVDVDIRNAINHGKAVLRDNGKEINFTYSKNRMVESKILKTYEFDKLLDNIYDTASAVLLGFALFINNHIDRINLNRNEETFTALGLFAMELSLPSIRVTNMNGVETPNQEKQLNVDVYIEDLDRTFILQTAVEIGILTYKRYSDYDKYFISFSNERLQTSWVRFTNVEIEGILTRRCEIVEAITSALGRKDVIIWDPATHEVDLQENKYYRYPNYSSNKFKINNVQDASLEDRKRLKAHLFVGNIDNKKELLMIFEEAINWIKNVRNIQNPTMEIKHGSMEADSIYINVYRNDSRSNKELFPKNENFVCFIDYNISGVTTLKNGGLPDFIWGSLYHEKVNNMDISWRKGRHATVMKEKKPGRNDPCSCESGKKYKRCCIDKN